MIRSFHCMETFDQLREGTCKHTHCENGTAVAVVTDKSYPFYSYFNALEFYENNIYRVIQEYFCRL